VPKQGKVRGKTKRRKATQEPRQDEESKGEGRAMQWPRQEAIHGNGQGNGNSKDLGKAK
jgi:hypothetical protein